MKHTLLILALITASIQTFAQSPRIKLNQITKDSVTGSVLISSPTDSGMVYSRDLFISYGADTVLILGGDTLAATSSIISSVLSDGVTITGDGTSGNELRVDTSIIATQGDLSNYVTIAGAETITGAKTFTSALTQSGGDVNFDSGTLFVDESADRVGIGTSSPSGKLAIYGTYASETEGLQVIGIGANAGQLSPISFYLQSSGWGTKHQATISAQQVSGSNGGADLFFSTSTTGQYAPTERMRITSAGYVGIGTSPSVQLELSTDGAKKLTTTTWTTGSDRRIKKNIINYDKGLNEIIQLNPVEYELNGKANTINGAKGIGLIAQEVQPIIPEAVTGYYGKLNEDDEFDSYLYNINTHSFFFMFINAFKEQQSIIESQATEIEQLKLQIQLILSEIEQIKNN